MQAHGRRQHAFERHVAPTHMAQLMGEHEAHPLARPALGLGAGLRHDHHGAHHPEREGRAHQLGLAQIDAASDTNLGAKAGEGVKRILVAHGQRLGKALPETGVRHEECRRSRGRTDGPYRVHEALETGPTT